MPETDGFCVFSGDVGRRIPLLVQGKVAVAVNVLAVPRITLAYARKRQTPMYADRIAKGHPRLCEEKVVM